MHWSDGNLAALAQYEREQDELDYQDKMLEDGQTDLASDLYDAYSEGKNQSVVAEVDDELMGAEVTTFRACERIAQRCESIDELEDMRVALRV